MTTADDDRRRRAAAAVHSVGQVVRRIERWPLTHWTDKSISHIEDMVLAGEAAEGESIPSFVRERTDPRRNRHSSHGQPEERR